MTDYIYTAQAAEMLGLGRSHSSEKVKELGLKMIKGPPSGKGHLWLVSRADVLAIKESRSKKLAEMTAAAETNRARAITSGLPFRDSLNKIDQRLVQIESALSLLLAEWQATREPVQSAASKPNYVNGAN